MEMLLPRSQRRGFEEQLDYDLIETADIKLMMAMQIIKDESCSGCGTPSWIAYNNDRNIGFETDSVVCFYCQARDQARDKAPKGLDMAGRSYYAKPYTYDGSDLPSRAEYMERLSGK